ncbi:hypothetical protein Bca4012_048563 [Brassica carinata]|uniref:Uncharacterized protein n=1 Tax=Brassica carinata TaxID=52824 RepID=A0A8X7R841_BRACI|nr:hypothetical protein Bca52824_051504 [Brassica carinata]
MSIVTSLETLMSTQTHNFTVEGPQEFMVLIPVASLGSHKEYRKQNKPFHAFAMEADKAFHEEYKIKKKRQLLPYAAWVREDILSSEINHVHERKWRLKQWLGKYEK